MHRLHRISNQLLALLFVATFSIANWAQAQLLTGPLVVTDQVRAELIAHAPQGVSGTQPVWVGLSLQHKPEWHTYWKNSGDSGLPTTLTWTLPEGVSAGEIAWPIPHKLKLGPLINYGYEGRVLLPVPITFSSTFKSDPAAPELTVKLKATWLVCRTECIPQEGDFTLNLPTSGATRHATDFAAAWAAQPQALKPEGSSLQIEGQTMTLVLAGLPSTLRGKSLDLFPETAEIMDPSAPWKQAWKGDLWTAQVPLSNLRSNSPDRMPVVVTGQGQGWRTELPIAGTWPAMTSATVAHSSAVYTASPALSLSLAAALLGALLGGLILNLMPCVFPVLTLKVMNFASHADDHRTHRQSGIAYTAGVVLSFMALGVMLLGFRAAGESLGWGFQLQNPWVVSGLAVLFTVIGLNLAGVFEFGQFAPSSLASLQLKHPVADSFLTGVLAVAVASPCTAPFMGASLGLAVGLPAEQALLIFAAIGAGLALPYLVASFVPAFARALPRPGAWMETLRKLLSFPMFATVVWLVWVLGQQSGIDGAGALLALLVMLAAVLWALTLKGRPGRIIATILIAATLWLVWAIGLNVVKTEEITSSPATLETWQSWAPGRVDNLLASDQPVFVDFTAAWCVTCQYNKKTTLSNPKVLDAFKAKNVSLLRADWTRRDPAITAALAQLGRNGVPVYVLYKKGSPPVVLPEILTVDEVLQALARL